MKNIHVNVQRPPANIPLGRQGENLATCIIFDCSGLVQLYGDGTTELLHELKDGTVYPVAIKQDGTSVSWIVTTSDTAMVGAGRAELRWYVGDTLAKSAKFRTSVSSALVDSMTGAPPAPQKSWVDKVLQAAQEIKDGAISDEQVRSAVDNYVSEHGLATGATAEQVAQIEQNTADISSLSEKVANVTVTDSGISATAKSLLVTILRNALYSTNQSENITLLEQALATSEDTGGDSGSEESVYYSITNDLTNVSNSNANTQMLENASYVANLTANDGYVLDSVTVTMGGTDVTSTVYADGVITISSVTGNIVIIASAIAEEEVVDPLYGTYWPPKGAVTDWSNHTWDGVENFVYSGNSGTYIDAGFPTTTFIRLDKLQGTLYIRTLTNNQYGVLENAYKVYANSDGEISTGGFKAVAPAITRNLDTMIVNDITYYFVLFKFEIPSGQTGYFTSAANAANNGYFISDDKIAINEEYKQYYTLFTSDPTDRITEGATEVSA